MKTSLIALLAGAAILLFSATSFADGDGCDSKKKGAHGKEMSTQAMKDFHKTHPWATKDGVTLEQSVSKKETAVKI